MSERMKTEEVAHKLGLPVQTLRVFLQYGKFQEFGVAIKKASSSQWIYYINRQRLEEYLGNKNMESIQLENN